ncbi:unnamed protein product [Rotaria socialis]|uniref:Uncharacterized protein n=1 Tax=Rotaria socialis TaxID=392032 RepID=A0A820YAD9_9BILA|nr:unnamed protein product [Rotaria socialis]
MTELSTTTEGIIILIPSTGITDIVRTAFKRGVNRFINRQTSYDSDVFHYTLLQQKRGSDGLFAGEACRLSPTICSHDEQCCTGRCLCRRWTTTGPDSLYIPYCTKNLYSHFKLNSTPDELHRLKQYLFYQKKLAVYLIKQHRSVISEFNRQGFRFCHKLCIDKKTFDFYGFSPLRSNPNLFLINEKQFNRILNSLDIEQNHLHLIKQNETHSIVKSDPSFSSIDNSDSQLKTLDKNPLKLNRCSSLIASGHGISKAITSLMNDDTKQSNLDLIYQDKEMIYIHIYVLVMGLSLTQASTKIVYLENCTYSIDLYKQYLNLIGSSNDSRTLHIQAVYSLSSNKSSIPGHINNYSSHSVAVIPFFVQCQSSKNISAQTYLPFTQCSSTVTNFYLKKNFESTRTNLNLRTILSMNNVPVIYMGEYHLILSNCSFKLHSTIYKLKPNEIFSFRIEYESSTLSDCSSCNRRTSICYEKTCQCRSGTKPVRLQQDKQYCIDITKNCTIDSQRCLYSKALAVNHFNELLCILIVLISFVFIVLLSLTWYLFRNPKRSEKDAYSNQSIFIIDKDEYTPSTLSSMDSRKLKIENEYPKIIGETNDGEILFILA